MTDRSKLELRPARPDDRVGIQDLVLARAPAGPHGYPETPEEWERQFKANPNGPDLGWVVVDEAGSVQGHVTTIPLPFDWNGRRVLCGKNEALVVSDLAAKQKIGEQRASVALVRGMTLAALDDRLEFIFSTGGLTTHWLYSQCGIYQRFPLVRRFVLLPLKPGRALVGWVKSQLKLKKSWPAWGYVIGEWLLTALRRWGRSLRPGGLVLEEIDRFDDRLRVLWSGFKAEAGVTHSLDRDPATFNWRFPADRYGRYWIVDRRRHETIGYLIARQEPDVTPDCLKVIDLVIQPSRFDCLGRVIDLLAGQQRFKAADSLVIDNYIAGRYSADLADRLARLTTLGRKGAAERKTFLAFSFGDQTKIADLNPDGWLINLLYMQYF